MKKIFRFLPSGLIIEKSGTATPNECLTRFFIDHVFLFSLSAKIELPDD